MSASVNPATLPLTQLREGNNPRRFFDPRKHAEMVASMKLRGVLQPLLVRPTAEVDVHEIVAGGRRYRAAQEAFGAEGEVPVIIRAMSDQEALEAAIDENDVRDDMSETEQADAAVRALAACKDDRAEAAARLGWSASKLERRLALAALSDAVKLALDERRIKVGHAELLAAVPPDKQDKALENILSFNLDVGKTREVLMRMTQELGTAIFDKTECTTCPFNSACQSVLFETHVDDGHCTNAACFQLKTDAVEQCAAERGEAAPKEEAATTPAPTPAKGAKPAPALPAPAKPAPTPSAPAKVKVTAESIAKHVTDAREAAWLTALTRMLEIDPASAKAFEGVLRDVWQVDRAFLARLTKDELKFVAQECGLVEHMGTKPFAKLLESPLSAIIDGMLNATGFDWAGRLPGAMAPYGKYSPPPSAPIADATPASKKD